MTDSYRDDLEATLRRADELERANAALVKRNAELHAPGPAAPAPTNATGLAAPVVLGMALVFAALLIVRPETDAEAGWCLGIVVGGTLVGALLWFAVSKRSG